jgi:sensor c-di-GMP phosphodiesterase-like protein
MAVVVLSIAGFVGGAQLVLDRIIETQNHRQLKETTARILERAEVAVDYAFIGLGEITENGHAHCGNEALVAIRRLVYQRGTIKDIRVIEDYGRSTCSAFPDTLGFDITDTAQTEMFPASNARIRLFRLEQQEGSALGLLWELDQETSLVAVINTDALLFDMLPPALRESSNAFLALGANKVIATFAPVQEAEMQKTGPATFAARSERYPLTASIQVDPAAFRAWNKDSAPLSMVIGGVLGFVFGLLMARAIARPVKPVEELDEAIAANEFRPHLQPIFSLHSGAVVGCEVLARWYRRDGTIVSPQRFIPLAEQSGRIVPLTQQVAAQALNRLQPLMKSDKQFTVALNIAPSHFVSPGFVEQLRALAADARVSTRQIVVEITERYELPDLDRASAVIDELQEHAFKVAIDDAGIGHSGLSYIQKLGVDVIKIDKFFIDSIGKDYSADVVVKMLVRLARELGMGTVAEGVETEQQVEVLRAAGVDEAQGFALAPPMPADQFFEFLREHALTKKDATLAGARAA